MNYIDRANDHVSKKNLEFNDKILRFTSKKPQIEGKRVTDFNNSLKFRNFKINKMWSKNEESIEFIQAEKVLDAPFMLDDMYLNLLDWNHQNLLAIALSKIVYIMNVSNRNVSPIQPQTKDWLVTSISWSSIDNWIAIGLENGIVEIWDAVKVKLVRKLYGHEGRVSSISWNKDIISTGGRDTLIINHDLKDRNHIISTFEDHYSEVWALKWSFDGSLLASGSNDNSLWIWDINNQKKPNHVLTKHRGAVKALAWCPIESNLLASGGGSDKYMRFWNADTGSEIWGIETGSQVWSLIWSKNSYELISAHGFETNQMFAWKFNSKNLRWPIVKTAELYGHEMRVLHLAINPEGTTVASASPDETLRFWKVFQSNEEENLDD